MNRTIRFATLVSAVTATVFILSTRLIADEPDSLRLDPNVAPTFQSIKLIVDAGQPEYSGSVSIKLRVRDRTSTFKFHAEDIILNTITLRNEETSISLTRRNGETGLVIVNTETELPPGQYTLDIDFSNELDTQPVGLYTFEAGGHSYTFTDFEPSNARKAFPCWDEPNFKIPYQIAVTVPDSYLAVSNTPIEEETVANGYRSVIFDTTKPLPSYLLALGTGPFEGVSIAGLSVPGKIFTVKGKTHLTSEAARVIPTILASLEKYFGSPYPFQKLDLIAVPQASFGAMEYPGAIAFLENLLLLDPNSSLRQRRRLTWVMAHELAHMWFGDMVTLAWWDDLWLNEAFAEWLGTKVADRLFPEYSISMDAVEDVQRAMRADAMLSARAIRQPISPRDNADEVFDVLTYNKGHSVLAMFERWLGAETFRSGVLDYIQSHMWGNATAEDFWSALSKAAGTDVGSSMATFLDQPGIPLVAAELLTDGKIKLSQRRFLHYGVQNPDSGSWDIPVIMRYPQGDSTRTESLLLTNKTQIVELKPKTPPQWIHLNAGEQGYYHWSAPRQMLMTLAENAQVLLNVRERVSFFGHLSALLDAGIIRADDHLKFVRYFADDTSPEVVIAVMDALQRIRYDFVDEDESMTDSFASYVRSTLRPAVERFGLTRVEGEDEAVSLLRPNLMFWVGLHGKDEKVMSYADSLAGSYMKDHNSIDPELGFRALRMYASHGDQALFDRYKRKVEMSESPTERYNYVLALGCFEDPRLIEEALEYAAEGPLRPQERVFLPNMIFLSSPRFRDTVFEWFMSRYDRLISEVPPYLVLRIPRFAGGASKERLEKARRFFRKEENAPQGTEKVLQKLEEGVMRRIDLREREGERVANYLKEAAKNR